MAEKASSSYRSCVLPSAVSRQTLATLLKVGGVYPDKVPSMDAADGALRLVHLLGV